MKITEITRWHKWSTILISRYMAGKAQLSSRISGRIIRWLEHCWFKLLEGSLGWSSGALCSIFVRQKIWWKENGGLGDATQHGSLNVTTEHHPTMRYLIYNCHSKVMSNSPKMGHLPIPAQLIFFKKVEVWVWYHQYISIPSYSCSATPYNAPGRSDPKPMWHGKPQRYVMGKSHRRTSTISFPRSQFGWVHICSPCFPKKYPLVN